MEPYANALCVLKVNVRCGDCKTKLMNVLGSITGVYSVNIDAARGVAEIEGQVDPNALLVELARSGEHAELIRVRLKHPAMGQRYPYGNARRNSNYYDDDYNNNYYYRPYGNSINNGYGPELLSDQAYYHNGATSYGNSYGYNNEYNYPATNSYASPPMVRYAPSENIPYHDEDYNFCTIM